MGSLAFVLGEVGAREGAELQEMPSDWCPWRPLVALGGIDAIKTAQGPT